jgi:hypothetical protein
MAKLPGQRVFVAVDVNASVSPLLRGAAELAHTLHAELHLLLLQNDELQQLAELPFIVETARQSLAQSVLSAQTIEREQRLRAKLARSEFERTLRHASLRGTCQVVANLPRSEIFARRKRGDIVCIYSDSSLQFSALAPQMKATLYVVYHRSKAGEHTLALARQLMGRGYRQMRVFVEHNIAGAIKQRLLEGEHTEVVELDDGLPDLLARLENRSTNTLLLPDDAPLVLNREELLSTLSGCRLETLVVH